ncbi:MAG TPA: FAD-dependent oxidoreductase [Candidatus Acidoferrales bacterium]|nr:FAD-dependent oxidoreductase [Candidatus Acidoferrales bacterium]
MRERFDVVVVGSGFGGAVTAYRLAKAGRRVCVLERGRAYPPGSFARTPRAVSDNFWDPSQGRYGLFNIWSFRGMSAIVSSGLGGGSLIYANVFIRKDAHWFEDPIVGEKGRWPITRTDLDPHYDAVERIVGLERYPAAYQCDNKTTAMRDAARRLGIAETDGRGDPAKPQWFLPQLAVTFTEPGQTAARPGRVFDEGGNLHHMPRETCRLCGECDVGCNYGAKNTMDYTYLTLAQQEGAQIRTLCEVKTFTTAPEGGYGVTYIEHDIGSRTRPGAADPPNAREIVADRLVICAGTLGSTYLLLKMRALGLFPNLSPMLGSRFSGNGDLLMFSTGCKDAKGKPLRLDASRAPVITSTFRFPDGEDDGSHARGFYLQDAGYPLILDYVWELLDPNWIPRWARAIAGFIRTELTGDVRGEIDRQIEEFIGDGTMSSSSMPLLGMGRDVPDGVMSTKSDPGTGVPLLELDWPNAPSAGYVKGAFARGCAVAQALGGSFKENPLTMLFRKFVTVHPLGGCPMGMSSSSGVVDARGEVFGYPGLYVADGSVLPGPVGANPSFTIAAVADHIADGIAAS